MSTRVSISAFVLKTAVRGSLALCPFTLIPSGLQNVAVAQTPDRAAPASSPYVGSPSPYVGASKGALDYRNSRGTGFNATGSGFVTTGPALSRNGDKATSPPSNTAGNASTASKRGRRPAGPMRGDGNPSPWQAPQSWQNDSIYASPWNSPTDGYESGETLVRADAALRSTLGGQHDSTSGQSRTHTAKAGYP